MLTVTKDLVLPATVTGSWPRPRWFTTGMWGRPLSEAMLDVVYREQLQDALSAVLDDQERAGLDILTNGDYFHDEDFAGQSWMRYPLERWRGLDRHGVSPAQPSPHPPGTLLREVGGAWRWPRVVGKVEPDPARPLEYGKLHRLAAQRTRKPVKFGTVAPQVMHKYLEAAPGVYDDNRRQLIWDLTLAMNRELRELAAAGCRVIQLEEPIVHHVLAAPDPDPELVDFLVDVWNAGVEGLEGVELWIHTCWGNPAMQRVVAAPSYADSVEIYLERMRGDVWAIETKEADFAPLSLLAPWKGRLPKKVAIGVVSHRTLQVESADEVADGIRRALAYVEPEQLVLTSDCGFGRQGCNRLVAYYKALAIARGRNIVLRELGLEERYIPGADPALQTDLAEPAHALARADAP